MKEKLKKVLLGVCGVDSGQLMICDPCYIDSQRSISSVAEEGCDGDCEQLNFDMGHAGAGVVFRSGYGDGCYNVFGYYNEEGRILKVEIEMG